MVCLGLDGRLSFALMLRRKNAQIAAGYSSQPCSSPERKILRAAYVSTVGANCVRPLRSAVDVGSRSVCSAPKGRYFPSVEGCPFAPSAQTDGVVSRMGLAPNIASRQ